MKLYTNKNVIRVFVKIAQIHIVSVNLYFVHNSNINGVDEIQENINSYKSLKKGNE